jgi:CHAT domain-containing protein/tetratricopeptide (TPR) repeat protein
MAGSPVFWIIVGALCLSSSSQNAEARSSSHAFTNQLVGTSQQSKAGETEFNSRIHTAQSFREQGKLKDAWDLYSSIATQMRQGQPSSQLGFVLNEMSKIASARGEYESSLQLANEAANVYQRLGDVKGQSHAINIKGLAQVDHGDYIAAEKSFVDALALSRSSGDTENEVQILNNIGSAYYFEGKYFEAMQSYEDAQQTLGAIKDAKWQVYWRQITEFNQATLYQRLGQYDRALELYKTIETSTSTMTSSDRAHLQGNLGTIYRRLGDPWKALQAYQNAQSLYAKDRDSDGEIGVLKNIGIVYALDLADFRNARRVFEQVLQQASSRKNRREEMQAHLYLGETFLLGKQLPNARSEFERARQMSEELGTPEENWKALYGLGQCEEQFGSTDTAERYYRSAIDLIEKARAQLQLSALRAEFLGDKRDVYDALLRMLFQKGDINDAFVYLERSRSRNFQDRILSQAENKPITLDEVRGRLAPAFALVEYWTSGDFVAAIWCTRQQTHFFFKNVGAEKKNEILDVTNGLPEADSDWRMKVAVLSQLIPAEWLTEEPELQHLLVIPDNWISLVPFDLIPNAAGHLLIERLDIAYAPSAALLRRPAIKRSPKFPWDTQLIAFADPIIGSSTTPDLLPLPFSSKEVHDIANIVPGKAELLLGPANQKSVFLGGKANSAPLLHVSTHSFADTSNPEDSRLLFSSEASNHSGGNFLYLRQMYGIDLSQVSLAVLSACDTERGKLARGEGVHAFSRALLASGASSAVTTLWKVDDRATAEFMKQFYFYAADRRMPRGEALRQAKLKFLRSNSPVESPKYWAAFVLSGESLIPLPTVLSWRTLGSTAAIAVGIGLAIGLWLAGRRRSNWKHDA